MYVRSNNASTDACLGGDIVSVVTGSNTWELFLVWEYFAMNNDTGYCCWLLLRWLRREDDEMFLVKYSLFADLIVWFWLH